MSRRCVFFFEDPPPDECPHEVLGGKGASLAEMSRAGWPVPPGFTISTEAGRYFFANGGAWPPEMEVQVRHGLERLEQSTKRVFGQDLLVAVRSGAAVSMPGMMDTVLNVGDGPQPWEELVRSINKVFRSWMSERAVAYRQRHRLAGPPETAVSVQAMFPSEVSGVLFTENPNGFAARQIVIEASRGLGEAIVSGAVTPDRFLVARDNFAEVRTFPAGEVAILTPAQIAGLCELALRVEKHYGHPLDLEWGWADGQFALLQARAMRGLDLARDAEAAREEEVSRLRALAGGRRRVWVAHNLGETLRFPTPLTWDIVSHFMSGHGGFGRMYFDLGYRPSREVAERGFLELIAGRIYADPERLAQLFWDGLPMDYDLDTVLRDTSALNRAPTRFNADRANGKMLLRLPGLVRAMLRGARNLKRLRPLARRHFEEVVLPPYLDYVRRKRAQDLAKLPTAGVLAEFRERRARVLDEFGKESLQPAFLGALARSALESLLVQLLGREEGARLTNTLTCGLPDTTREQDVMLARVARGEATLEKFVEEFGHRATGEMELSEPRWREDQTYLNSVLRQLRSADDAAARGEAGRALRRALEEVQRENAAQREAAERGLPALLALAGGSALREEIEEERRAARALLPFRETGRHFLMMGYELIRLAIVELGRRWDLGGDIFFLRLEELENFEADRVRLAGQMERRKIRWQSVQRLDLPEVIDSEHLSQFGRSCAVQAVSEWKGEPISPGVGEGRARVVFDARDAAELGNEYVLVCPTTDPGWTPLFLKARALVVERGGLLSHGAIVARDFGLPAVVCADATRLLRSGDLVRVDGHTGVISKLKEEP